MTQNQKILIGIGIAVAVIVAIFFGLRYYARRKHANQLAKEKASGIDIESQWLESDLAKKTNLEQAVQLLAASANHYNALVEKAKELDGKAKELDALLASNKKDGEAKLPTNPNDVNEDDDDLENQNQNGTEQQAPVMSVVRDATPIEPIADKAIPSTAEVDKPVFSAEGPATDFKAFLDISSNPSPDAENTAESAVNAVITAGKGVNPVIPAQNAEETKPFETENDRIAAMEQMEYQAIKNSESIEEWTAFKDSIEVCSHFRGIAGKKIKALMKKQEQVSVQQ